MADTAPQGRLATNIVYFARALRAAGIPVGPGAVLDALAAVQAAGVGTRDDFYWTLHAVFVKRHEHSLLFDQAFRMFFRKRAYLDKLLAMLSPQAPAAAPEAPDAGAQRVQDALFAGMCGPTGWAKADSLANAQTIATEQCHRFGGKTCVIRAWVCDARG